MKMKAHENGLRIFLEMEAIYLQIKKQNISGGQTVDSGGQWRNRTPEEPKRWDNLVTMEISAR